MRRDRYGLSKRRAFRPCSIHWGPRCWQPIINRERSLSSGPRMTRCTSWRRPFRNPMGMAVDKGRLAIGSTTQIFMFQDALPRGPRRQSPGRPDACFLPRWSTVTGNIFVHELAWAVAELWIVNARFSCLCTLDNTYSFMPRWRPPFVSALAPEDRCHLNGLCVVNGRPKYVTAHGQSDEPGGWRDGKSQGGVLIDVESDEIVLRGLAMPHSPRFYDGKLWVLDSGRGSIGFVDTSSRYQMVADSRDSRAGWISRALMRL